MRDSQRQRVYDWEERLHSRKQWVPTMSIHELEAYVKRIWRSERGRVGLAKRNPPIVRARRGSSASSFTGLIEFGTKCHNEIVALHELAHELDRNSDGRGHGPRFVGIVIGLYARHLDMDANEMMTCADEGGVKYHVRSIGVVPIRGVMWKLAKVLQAEKPMTEMELACWLDVSYLQVRGSAMGLIKRGQARWLRGKLVPLGELLPPPEPVAKPKRQARPPGPNTAKALAKTYDIEIEHMPNGGGHMVYPPSKIEGEGDPFDGDHWCDDWGAVDLMVRRYVELLTGQRPTNRQTVVAETT